MSTEMGKFLIKLSQDPFLAEKFKDDPESVMASFNLTPEETSLLSTRDAAAIHRVVRGAGGLAAESADEESSGNEVDEEGSGNEVDDDGSNKKKRGSKKTTPKKKATRKKTARKSTTKKKRGRR